MREKGCELGWERKRQERDSFAMKMGILGNVQLGISKWEYPGGNSAVREGLENLTLDRELPNPTHSRGCSQIPSEQITGIWGRGHFGKRDLK